MRHDGCLPLSDAALHRPVGNASKWSSSMRMTVAEQPRNKTHKLAATEKCITSHISLAQHSTAQHSTAQHSTAQHSTAQHSTAQHSTAHVPHLQCLICFATIGGACMIDDSTLQGSGHGVPLV